MKWSLCLPTLPRLPLEKHTLGIPDWHKDTVNFSELSIFAVKIIMFLNNLDRPSCMF